MTVTVTKDRVKTVFQACIDADQYEVIAGVGQQRRNARTGRFEKGTDKRNEGNMRNAALAYIHNYGSPAANIPARPFLEPGIKNAKETVAQLLGEAVKDAMAGKPRAIQNGLQKVGIATADAIKDKIRKGPFTPLKAATIARKGSSRPLIDTAQMLNAVGFIVRKKKKKK